jgi:hypothetical protein
MPVNEAIYLLVDKVILLSGFLLVLFVLVFFIYHVYANNIQPKKLQNMRLKDFRSKYMKSEIELEEELVKSFEILNKGVNRLRILCIFFLLATSLPIGFAIRAYYLLDDILTTKVAILSVVLLALPIPAYGMLHSLRRIVWNKLTRINELAEELID